jgi:hypothetical protein
LNRLSPQSCRDCGDITFETPKSSSRRDLAFVIQPENVAKTPIEHWVLTLQVFQDLANAEPIADIVVTINQHNAGGHFRSGASDF